jgi:hypothetical protein
MTNKATLKVTLVVSILIFAAVIAYSSYFSYLNNSNSFVFAEQSKCFNAKLTGKDEVPSKNTKATGFVEFNANGNSSMSYKINVTNIEKAKSVHIHEGKVGENGISMMIVYKTDFPSATTNGVLSSGNITSENLENQSPVTNLKDLINLMNNGEVYVHIHTEANPAGEIRGQLLPCNAMD